MRRAMGAVVLAVAGTLVGGAGAAVVTISADRETVPVSHSGDAADDPAVWHNADNLELSRVIATDKQGGLNVYALDGGRVQTIATTPNGATLRPNNVDVTGDIVGTANDASGGDIVLWRANRGTGMLTGISGSIDPGVPATADHGFCLYDDGTALYAFVIGNTSTGDNDPARLEQWRITLGTNGFTGTKVRTIDLPAKSEARKMPRCSTPT